jgi:23S rRNA (cytidine1920-2'-O)/16S rRNA (cytidine1409-2'-O)-methyltransferase
VVDFGASTGGFTDCLLQHGARKVYAVDVGQGQLAWRLRHDPRVQVMERVNARYLTPAVFPNPSNPWMPWSSIARSSRSGSCSRRRPLLPTAGRIVALVKPQFEAGKREADRGAGVIRDPAVHQRVLGTESFVEAELPLRWLDLPNLPCVAGRKHRILRAP